MTDTSDINQIQYEDLQVKAQNLFEEEDFEVCSQFVERLLQINGDDLINLELRANLELELGDWQTAYQMLESIVVRNKDDSPSVYMTLAQLTVGQESVKNYELGVSQYLARTKNSNLEETKLLDIKRKVSNGFVALSEIYLTDLCFEADAESRCESYLSRAIEIDGDNPDIYMTLASVRLSQTRPDEAKSCLDTNLDLWLRSSRIPPPSYPTRISIVRMLIEVEALEEALQVLKHLERENDQIVEIWYLSSLVHYMMAQLTSQDIGWDTDLIENSWECLVVAQQLAQQNGEEDQDILEAISEISVKLLDINPKLVEMEVKLDLQEEELNIEDGDEQEYYTDEENMEE